MVISLLPGSFQRKLLAVMLLTTLVALLAALAAIAVYDLRAYHRNWSADLEAQADLLGRSAAAALALEDPRIARENLGVLRARPRVRLAAVYNARGALFAAYAATDADAEQIPERPEAEGSRVRENRLHVARRIVEDGAILGTVYIEAEYGLYERLNDYIGIAGVVALIAMLIALALSAWLQGLITRPILAIVRVAREVAERHDYSRRAVKISDDEVGTLVESFNDMLAQMQRQTRELEDSNRMLALEIEERTRTEQEIARLNAELEKRVHERTGQLEDANRELEAFCSSVSHDLRAPLRAIDGFSQALMEDFPADIPADGQRYLERIRSSTQRMSQLIEDLLNLSRLSRQPLERAWVDAGQMAQQIVAELRQREPGREITVSIMEGMMADADPRLLRAALENLVGNAWKFTSRKPQARIEIGVVQPEASLTGTQTGLSPDADIGQPVFFVRDNGAGFDMSYADKLFGAFQRLHPMNDFPGTGIGLATVQRIVHRHGGRIWADARVDLGAVFYFTLAYGRPAVVKQRSWGAS